MEDSLKPLQFQTVQFGSPRQVIQLLAEMARRTPLSVGCYCDEEAKCHRSVLRVLIREAAASQDTAD